MHNRQKKYQWQRRLVTDHRRKEEQIIYLAQSVSLCYLVSLWKIGNCIFGFAALRLEFGAGYARCFGASVLVAWYLVWSADC